MTALCVLAVVVVAGGVVLGWLATARSMRPICAPCLGHTGWVDMYAGAPRAPCDLCGHPTKFRARVRR